MDEQTPQKAADGSSLLRGSLSAPLDDIRPEFRLYVKSLLSKLHSLKSIYKALEAGTPAAHLTGPAMDSLLTDEAQRFNSLFDSTLADLQEQTADFTTEDHTLHARYFRRHVWPFILESPFLSRTNLRPRGYAGDAEMMRMVYANSYEGRSLMGKLLHKHPIESLAAQAVRNRRRLISDTLREFAVQQGSRPLRVMSVACGPAYELQDVLSSAADFKRYCFTLLDQDDAALAEAAQAIERCEKLSHQHANVAYVHESIRRLLQAPQTSDEGSYAFIYSMGLFDYLTKPVANLLTKRLFERLDPGGILLIGNYHIGNATRIYMTYWMDWTLAYRTEQEMLDLLRGVPQAQCFVGFEPSGTQMFLRAQKQA